MRVDEHGHEVKLQHLLERSGYVLVLVNEVRVDLEGEHQKLKESDPQIDFKVLVGMEEA